MSILFSNLEKFKSQTALIGPDNNKYSYNQILNRIRYINSKIENRSLILIVASNSIQSIIGYITFIRSNNVSILLDKSFKVEYVKKIIKRYKPNYIYCPKGYINKIEKIYKSIPLQDYSLIKTSFTKHKKINKQNLLLLSTSGTTQNPKFVRLSNANLQNNTKSIIKYLKINSSHTTITTMPMGYSYGLSIINTHLESGSKIVVSDKTIFDREFWHKVNKYKVTSFGGVPQFYEQLKKLKFENFNLSSLKYITQAGGKLDKNFLNYFKNVCMEKKIKFITMYGQTEASPRMSYLKWEKFSEKLESIGKPLDGTKFKLLDKKGNYIQTPYSVGELVYFGNNVSLGYAHNVKDLKKGNENKGKLLTGDLAYKDDEGYFYITGRKKRISKVFGIRIDLDDIEKKLKRNGFKVKCLPDNKYLKILITNDYNTGKIKKIIYKFYGINKIFILISKVKQFTNPNYFKEVVKFH